jgi:tetraacyldisaccharide 4'-kinase
MRSPGFWWKNRRGGRACLLAPLGFIYGRITAHRMGYQGQELDCPVICVGNWTAGGAGKTPVALSLSTLLREKGWQPVFLSRGYGGAICGPMQIDGRSDPSQCGDEPLLLAREAPTFIAKDRLAGALEACQHGNLIIMDDGLQNPSLQKNIRLAVVDARVGIGNGLCVPAGPMRAPLRHQWRHTDAVILVGEGEAGETIAAKAPCPVFRGRTEADPEIAAILKGKKVMAVAGIGRPQKLYESLESVGAEVKIGRAFDDHHTFDRHEIEALVAESAQNGLTLVTTAKDHVRIMAVDSKLAKKFKVLPIRFVADHPEALIAWLHNRLQPVKQPVLI